MRGAFALLWLLAGCHKLLGLAPVDPPDAPVVHPDGFIFEDAPPPGTLCAGVLYFQECAPQDVPNLDYSTAQLIDTDSSACTLIKPQQNMGPDVCVIVGYDVTVTAEVRAHGSRPLAIFAMHDFTIDTGGTISVSSDGAGAGAGADVATCVAPAGDDQMLASSISGGGAGGSFGGQGGDGGYGPRTAKAMGTLSALAVRGGCGGGNGGKSHVSMTVASGGSSGGGLYLVAGNTLTVKGWVLANGIGGKGATKGTTGDDAGGGGGGSGGLIALDAKLITLGMSSILQASGGGGGGGADGANGTNGGDGANPSQTSPTSQAGGGSGGTSTLDGGRGNYPSMSDPDAGNGKPTSLGSQGGGGGGGGGAGIIHLLPISTVLVGTQAPTPS